LDGGCDLSAVCALVVRLCLWAFSRSHSGVPLPLSESSLSRTETRGSFEAFPDLAAGGGETGPRCWPCNPSADPRRDCRPGFIRTKFLGGSVGSLKGSSAFLLLRRTGSSTIPGKGDWLPTRLPSCFFWSSVFARFKLGMRSPKPRNCCRKFDGGSLIDWLRLEGCTEYTELTLLRTMCLRYGFELGPAFLPFIFSKNKPTPAGKALSFSLVLVNCPSPPSLFSLMWFCRFSDVSLFRLLRQKNTNALMRAKNTTPPTTPPAIPATLTRPAVEIVSPFPPADASGLMIPPGGIVVGCGCPG
jgi:hypothetical protein